MPCKKKGKKIIHTLHKKKKRIIHTLNKSVNKIIHVLSPQEEEKKIQTFNKKTATKMKKMNVVCPDELLRTDLARDKNKVIKRKEKRPQFYHGLVATQNATDDFGQLTICMSKTILPDICPPP